MQALNETHWKRVGTRPIAHEGNGKLWEVECLYCGQTSSRTTREINNNIKKCSCRTYKREAIMLTIGGEERPLTFLLKLYPQVNDRSARQRHSNRSRGLNKYTDDQVFFGAQGMPKAGSPRDLLAGRAQATGLVHGFTQTVKTRMNTLIDEMLGEHLVKLITPAHSPKGRPRLAGENYEMQTVPMIISELLETDQHDDIREFLGLETFSSPEDKSARLSPFIPVNLQEWSVITPLEIMALTSILQK